MMCIVGDCTHESKLRKEQFTSRHHEQLVEKNGNIPPSQHLVRMYNDNIPEDKKTHWDDVYGTHDAATEVVMPNTSSLSKHASLKRKKV
jgi:hypothetical protein